jgi:ArsR family transcriptional regulator
MDQAFKALADPTRRQILELLRDEDVTAGDIASKFPMAFASVSHHLNVLKQAGLVLTTREGQHIRYSLNTTAFQDLLLHLMEIAPRRRVRKRGNGNA